MSLQRSYIGRRNVGVNDAGQLDRRLTLFSPTYTAQSNGEPLLSWTTVATVWGSKRSLNGHRLLAADGTHYEQFTAFEIRYRDDIRTGWRVQLGTSVYEVTNTQELGRKHLLEIVARSVDQAA